MSADLILLKWQGLGRKVALSTVSTFREEGVDLNVPFLITGILAMYMDPDAISWPESTCSALEAALRAVSLSTEKDVRAPLLACFELLRRKMSSRE